MSQGAPGLDAVREAGTGGRIPQCIIGALQFSSDVSYYIANRIIISSRFQLCYLRPVSPTTGAGRVPCSSSGSQGAVVEGQGVTDHKNSAFGARLQHLWVEACD